MRKYYSKLHLSALLNHAHLKNNKLKNQCDIKIKVLILPNLPLLKFFQYLIKQTLWKSYLGFSSMSLLNLGGGSFGVLFSFGTGHTGRGRLES